MVGLRREEVLEEARMSVLGVCRRKFVELSGAKCGNGEHHWRRFGKRVA
jgi:hypothetical protein